MLFTPHCSRRAREFPRSSTFVYDVRLLSYGASEVAQSLNFGLFFLYKTPKTYLPVASLQPMGYIAEWLISPCGSRRSKGVPSGTGDFLRLLVGELATPVVAQIFAYGKCLYPYIMLLHGASNLDQRCLKMRNSEDECTFPPNIFAPPPKITQNRIFGGPFNAKPIIQWAIRRTHVNGATTLKLYGYIGIGKYLEVCQNFSARGHLGEQGPLM